MPLELNPLLYEKESVNPLLYNEEGENEFVPNPLYDSYRKRRNVSDIANLTNESQLATFNKFRPYTTKDTDNALLTTVQQDFTSKVDAAISTSTPDEAMTILQASQDAMPENYWEAAGWSQDPLDIYREQIDEELAVANLLDEATVWQYVRDIFVPTLSKDASDLLQANDPISVQRHVRLANQKWKDASPDMRAEMLPELTRQALEAADGNAVTAARLVELITGSGEDITAAFFLDKVDVGLSITDVGSLIKGLYNVASRSAKVANAVAKARREARAVEEGLAMNEGIKDAKAAEELGTTVENIATGAMDQEGLLDLGIPANTGENIDRAARMAEDYVDEIGKTSGKLGIPDIEEEARKAMVKEIRPLPYDLVAPDAGLGTSIEAKVQYPWFKAIMQNARVSMDYLKPIVTNLNTNLRKSGLSKDQWNDLMYHLDDLQKEDSFAEIAARLASDPYNLSGDKLGNGIEYYIKSRNLYDEHYKLTNKAYRASKINKGYESLATIADRERIAHKFESVSDARRSATDRDVKVFWDEERQEMRRFDSLGEKEIRTFVRTETPASVGDNAWEYFALAPEHVQDLPLNLLNKRIGYVPKTNKNLHYIVSTHITGKLNNKANQILGTVTEQGFSTEAKAIKFKEQLMAQRGLGDKQVHISRARELRDPDDIVDTFNLWGGGLYTGKRKSTELLVDGEPGVRKYNASESLRRALDFVQRHELLGPTRDRMRDIWTKTALDNGTLQEKNANAVFKERANSLVGDPNLKQKMKVFHNYIHRMTDEASSLEQVQEQIFVKAAESINLGWAQKALMKTHDWNTAQKLKGFVYHAYLGVFSMAQQIVQMSVGVPIMAVHPIAFAKAAPNMVAAGIVDNWPAAAKYLNKGQKELYNMWKESGMRQSIRNHPDLAHMSGYTSALSKLEKTSTFFADSGEIWGRRMAFFTAAEAKKGGPFDEIMFEARRIWMDMTSANKARYQEGLPGLITQFQQIMGKTYGQTMPVFLGGKASITTGEKLRIAGLETAFWGMAGIPFGTAVYNFYNEMTDKGIMTSGEAELWKRGMSGWILDRLGIHANIQTRLAIAASLPMALENAMQGNGQGFAAFLGPGADLMGRMYNAFNNSKDHVKNGRYDLVLRSFASIPSSTRNILKAYLAHQYGVSISRDNRVFSAPEMTTLEKGLQAMGFSSTKVDDYFDLQAIKKSRRATIDYYANLFVSAYKTDNGMTPDELGQWGAISALDPYIQHEIFQEVGKKLKTDEGLEEKMIKDFFLDPMSQMGSNPTMLREIEKLQNAN